MWLANSSANRASSCSPLGLEQHLELLDGDHQPTLGGVSGTWSRPSWAISIDSTATALSAALSSGPFQRGRQSAPEDPADGGHLLGVSRMIAPSRRAPIDCGEAGLVPEEQAGVADHPALQHDPRVGVPHRQLVHVVVAAALGLGQHLQLGAEPGDLAELAGGDQR